MNWEQELNKIEDNFGCHRNIDWQVVTKLIPELVRQNCNNFKIYVRVIYIFHNILVEEMYDESDGKIFSDSLKKYFKESYTKFLSELEYSFFIGKILYIAEWYFDINDDFKPTEEKLAFKMQKYAYENEPDNKLYKWAYLLSIGDLINSQILSNQILEDSEKTVWLKNWGFPGKYITESLQWSQSR